MSDLGGSAPGSSSLRDGGSSPPSEQRAAGARDREGRGACSGHERPPRFELVINLRVAKALGLTIRQSVLSRANQVIPVPGACRSEHCQRRTSGFGRRRASGAGSVNSQGPFPLLRLSPFLACLSPSPLSLGRLLARPNRRRAFPA